MPETLLVLRLIADILWPYKEVTAIVALSAVGFTLYKATIGSRRKRFVIAGSSFFLFLFYLMVVFNYFRGDSDDALAVFVKITANVSLFYLGYLAVRDGSSSRYRYLGKFLILECVLLFGMSFLGLGFISWGSVLTFVGPYFFKTDLAIACLIAATVILASDFGRLVKLATAIVTFYLMWISNSRVSILSFLIVIYLWKRYFFDVSRDLDLGKIALVLWCFVILSVFLLVFGAGDGMLGFDFSEDFFSEKNTQGRNLIWEALFLELGRASFLDIVLGQGLGADQVVVARDTQFEVDSHNTFLSIYFNVGAMAFVFFLCFLFFVFSNLKALAKFNSVEIRRDLFLGLAFYCIFAINSFSMSLIIFQQLTWFFMYFAGGIVARLMLVRRSAQSRYGV